MKANFRVYTGLWQRNGYMSKGREMTKNGGRRGGNGEMERYNGHKRKKERETDWELTQSGETPALIRVGSSAASGHCVGGGGDNGR